MAWIFGDFRLDPERFELSCGAELVRLEPQVLALLCLLVRHHDRMVTKGEIVEKIWLGQGVSDASISSRIRSARQAVGDDGHHQMTIRTVHGRGFRFVAEVVETAPAQAAKATAPPEPNSPLTGRPSIAILPFRPLAMTPELAILADAIPYEIIQALSRLRWLAVIARGSSHHYSPGRSAPKRPMTFYHLSGCLVWPDRLCAAWWVTVAILLGLGRIVSRCPRQAAGFSPDRSCRVVADASIHSMRPLNLDAVSVFVCQIGFRTRRTWSVSITLSGK